LVTVLGPGRQQAAQNGSQFGGHVRPKPFDGGRLRRLDCILDGGYCCDRRPAREQVREYFSQAIDVGPDVRRGGCGCLFRRQVGLVACRRRSFLPRPGQVRQTQIEYFDKNFAGGQQQVAWRQVVMYQAVLMGVLEAQARLADVIGCLTDGERPPLLDQSG
jgi:hypothetical protein